MRTSENGSSRDVVENDLRIAQLSMHLNYGQLCSPNILYLFAFPYVVGLEYTTNPQFLTSWNEASKQYLLFSIAIKPPSHVNRASARLEPINLCIFPLRLKMYNVTVMMRTTVHYR
jgi:hypothetical protein